MFSGDQRLQMGSYTAVAQLVMGGLARSWAIGHSTLTMHTTGHDQKTSCTTSRVVVQLAWLVLQLVVASKDQLHN